MTECNIFYDKIWPNIQPYVTLPEEIGDNIFVLDHVFRFSLHNMKLKNRAEARRTKPMRDLLLFGPPP